MLLFCACAWRSRASFKLRCVLSQFVFRMVARSCLSCCACCRPQDFSHNSEGVVTNSALADTFRFLSVWGSRACNCIGLSAHFRARAGFRAFYVSSIFLHATTVSILYVIMFSHAVIVPLCLFQPCNCLSSACQCCHAITSAYVTFHHRRL